jgi:4-amino-4-deoxy-L-arabinose transferase-like glycosyltransferase
VKVRRRPGDLAVLAGVAGLRLALHVATAPGYGIFRDELYYLACADHLDFGYVDHPPLSIALLAFWRFAFGDGLFALRFLPGVAGAATVFLTGLVARELGGGRGAQVIAALAAFFAPFFLAVSHFYSMNAFDLVAWSALWWLAVRILERDEPRLWLWFGVVAGLGLQNKYSVGFLGFGLVLGLALTAQRRQLRSPWLWVGGAVAGLLFAPHLVWQIAHSWPSLEFMRNASELKNQPLSPLEFLGGQVVLLHPLLAPLWALGLLALLFGRSFARVRALGLAYVAIFALMLFTKAKVYYLAPAYPLLFAAGAVALDAFFARRAWRNAPAVAGAAVVVAGLALVPMTIPVLPPDTFIAYSDAIGVSAPKMERGARSELPQVYADMFGWRELTDEVARVFRALPEHERARAVIVGGNYGEAGAIDHFGPALGLPRAISPHNSYWLWGPGDWDGRVAVVIGEIPPEIAAEFGSIEKLGHRSCARCVPFERELSIHVARDLRIPVSELWARLKRFI